jgi:hypothetical protein
MNLITAWKNWRGGNGYRSRGKQYANPEEDRPFDLPKFLNDHKDILESVDHQTLLAACRYIYNRFAVVQGAIGDKANFVVGHGWNAQFYGTDEAWGDEAENFLLNWGNICDVRGQPFNFIRNLHTGSITLDRDGEYFTYLRKNANGYPLTQMLESHRIADRQYIKSVVLDGVEYAVRNGIAYNVESRAMYYHFLGDDKSLDQWIPASDIIHHYDPLYFSQGRGISPLVVGILDYLDIHESRENEKFAQRLFSSLAFKHKTETGKPDPFSEAFSRDKVKRTSASDADASTPVPSFTDHIYQALKGGVRFLKFGGEDIESFENNRPQVNTQNFEKTVLRGALVGLQWGYEQVVESTLSGAAVRRDITKCQRAVEDRQQAMLPFWLREVQWATACAIKIGILLQSVEWWMFEPQLPLKMSADAFRDADADAKSYVLGTTTLQALAAKEGNFWKDIRIQREKEALDLLNRARNVMTANPELSLNDCINLLEQRTPNGNASTANNNSSGDSNDSPNGTSTNVTNK